MANRKFLDICPSNVACDGAELMPGRTICGPCEEKLRKRAKEKKLKELEDCRMSYAAKRRRAEIQRALKGDEV